MRSLRSMFTATLSTSALLVSTASVAHADDRQLFVWSGTVDREAIIVMRGGQIETQGEGFEVFRDTRFRVREPLPRMAGIVRVVRSDGRGEVDVIEQPSPFNGFTTRVRVRDRASGADRYRLEAYWDGPRGGRGDRWEDDDRDDDRRDRRGDRGRGNGGFGGWRVDDRGIGGHRDAGVLRFSAVVDDVAEIRIRGRRVDFLTRSGRPVYDVRYDVRGAGLPMYAIPLDVRRLNGRGNVSIAQYPRAWNNWTAVIRINDSRGGADAYDIDLRW
jgi:hypothetical protein